MSGGPRHTILAAALVAALLGGEASAADPATFESRRAAVMKSIETQPEAAVRAIVEEGIALAQPAQALAAAREWLRVNLPKDPAFLYHAGRAAELSGEWDRAVVLYQQFLEQADPKSAQAGDAITGVYALAIQYLDDPATAYAFGRGMAPKLAVNPRFRQFDRWFLDTAIARADRPAVATRLLATARSGASADEFAALHEGDLRWLVNSMTGVFRYDTEQRFTPEFVADCKALAATLPPDDERRLLLDFVVSVKPYNQAKIAGQEAAPPLAEAKALVEKFPRYAAAVQLEWAGGNNGPYYRDKPEKYWPHELEGKLAPIRAALPKLAPAEQADLLATWSLGHYVSGSQVLTVEQVREFALANPQVVNQKWGPVLAFGWNTLDDAATAKLAAILEQNPSPEASLVRAAVAAGKERDYQKAMDALLGPEVWRLGVDQLNGAYADQLWHWAKQAGGVAKRDEQIARSKAVAAQVQAATIKKEAPAPERLAAFKQLLADFRSPKPQIPAVAARLAQALSVTPEAVPELLRDPGADAQRLLAAALATDFEGPQLPLSGDANVRGLSPSAHDPIVNRFIARHGGNINHLKQHNLYRAHPLEPVLRQAVAERLGKPSIEPWLLVAWVNAQGPKDAVDPAGKPVGDAEQVKLVEALVKSPAWAALPAEARFAVRSAFPRQALPPAQLAVRDAAEAALICKDLLALPKEANAAVTAAALGAAIEGLLKSPVRCDVVGIEKLAEVAPEVFADPQVIGRIVELADSVRSFNVPPPVGQRFFETVNKSRDPATLEKTAAWLWRYVQTTHVIQPVIALADSLVDEKPAAASTLAAAGLGTIARHKYGHTYFNAAVDVPRLQSIRGRAAMKLGLVVIPVPPDHPAYPVYQSQAEWLTGNEDTAGQLLDDNWDAFLAAHRQLSVPYLMWALKRSIYARDDARQEALIRPLLAWIAEPVGPFTPAEKVALEIAYGDIAVQRGQLREAYEIFARTRANPAYKDLLARHDAALKQAGVARATKDFESALATLAELDGERIPELWAPVRHARAEVFFDMEEYDDAADVIDSILARDPDDAEARILLGKVQVKRQQLMEATEVEFGSAAGQKTLVPGEKLKVTLNDPTLAVSGAGTEIEVAVWTTAGDREQFLLRRFGDQKEKFRGEVATALGAPAAGDGTLQVLGDDEIFYAYSDRFREKIPGLPDTRGGPITVVSDALLQASARKLPSEAEQRLADVREVMAKLGVSETKAGKMLASQKGAAVAETAARAAEAAASVAKPGNPIHVRVTDPDRSRTAQIDELAVSVASSSGDSVSRVVLRETGPVTGRFEGTVPTKPAQASAFAANSEPGRNPNMVISPVASYPAWKPVATKGVVPEFTIDLNDNVPLGELTITAAEPGARLTKFAVQTALNTGEWTTVAVQPKNMLAVADPWGPSVAVLNDTDDWQMNPRPAAPPLAELAAQADRGWMTQQFPLGLAENVAGPSAAFPESFPKAIAWKRHNQHDNAHVIHRFRGWFHEPAAVTRKFRLDLGPYQLPAGLHPSMNQPAQHLLAVDGVPITKFGGPLEAEIALEPGVHRFEIWSVGWVTSIGFGRTAKLLANVDAKDPAALVACPDTFFDPKSFPPGAIDHRNAPAELAASPDGSQFRVTFAKGSRARFIRLQLLGHEGPVPALGKIALTSADGKPVLPVAEDFAALNKNETLEMLPGDTVAVRYVDDRFVTKAKETQERSLKVAFTDARVEFADMEPRLIEGEMRPFYERLLRYRRDEPLTLAIHDADMDVSTEPDTVAVTLASKAGGRQEFKAIETGESTGVFKLVITPVAKDAELAKPAAGGQQQKPVEVSNPFVVADGDAITATYRDQENNKPGVPTDRVAKIDHALFVQPRLLLANARVEPIAPAAPAGAPPAPVAPLSPDRPRWTLTNTLVPTDTPPEGGFSAVAGQPLYAEFVAPSLVLRPTSTVTVYAQTDTGRRLAAAGGATADGGKKAAAPAFDTSVPGTIAVEAALTPARLRVVPRRRSDAGPRDPDELPLVGIYAGGSVWQPFAAPTSDRFCITIPLLPGVLPDHGVLSAEEIQERRRQEANLLGEDARPTTGGLVVRPGDRVHLGIRFADAGGAEQWLTASTAVVTHPALDLVTKDDAATMTSGYVGETIRMRVVDLGADATDSADAVGVNVQAKSGGKAKVVLHETGPHSGIFEGACVLTYATAPGQTPAPPEDEADDPTAAGAAVQQLPVVYGDTVAARYTDKKGASTETSFLTVSKGADGSIAPFSKTYGDSEIAAQTQFSLAEAYLEMAKRHRGLGQIEAADREYAAAKQMLAGVMNQFNDAETRAHAEFLLGNLTFEEAKTAKDPAAREELLRAALARFMNVTGSYETTPHASKAQFAIATVYEALGEPELAAQDYVKLAYKYPDSEFLAKSMARLGTFFLKRASAYEKQAEPLLAKAETDADAKFQGEKLREQAIGEYVKTARIFGRLQERFPGNELAGPAGLQAGRAYMRAGDRQRALDTFSRVARDQGYDGPKVRAEAMYWAGNCYQQMGQPMAAFSTYKRLTYDFPETEWAKNAIGQLSQPALLELESRLELERLETQQK
jgi:outer membrane protein assembly factor BamD (BamD/ComL family)